MTPAKPTKTIYRDLGDPPFYVVMTGDPTEAYVEFKVYSIIGHGRNKEIYLEKIDGECGDQVQKVEEAEVYLSGSIKFDGCSNMKFDEQDRVMLHFCGRKQAVDIGVLMDRLYSLAAELMPRYAEDLK